MTLLTALLFAMIGLQLGDIFSTKLALSVSLKEGNETIQGLMDRFGSNWGKVKYAVAVGAGALIWYFGPVMNAEVVAFTGLAIPLAEIALGGMCLFYAWVIFFNNLPLWRKHRG